MILNNEQLIVRKEAIVAYFNALYRPAVRLGKHTIT
jgi:hypothetical protein